MRGGFVLGFHAKFLVVLASGLGIWDLWEPLECSTGLLDDLVNSARTSRSEMRAEDKTAEEESNVAAQRDSQVVMESAPESSQTEVVWIVQLGKFIARIIRGSGFIRGCIRRKIQVLDRNIAITLTILIIITITIPIHYHYHYH